MIVASHDTPTTTHFPEVPLRFIIADDEHSITTLIARVITRIYPGSVITTVANGKEALRVYEEHGADLIVTDRRMPELDGLELISAIRAQDVATPILLISAEPNVTSKASIVDKTHFLPKPLTIGEFVAALTFLILMPTHQALQIGS